LDGKEINKIVYFPPACESLGVYKEVIHAVTANFIQYMKCNNATVSNTYCIIIIVYVQELEDPKNWRCLLIYMTMYVPD